MADIPKDGQADNQRAAKRNRATAVEVTYPDNTAKGLPESNGSLCEACRTINFEAIFSYRDEKVYNLGTWAHLLQNTECYFCRFMVHLAKASKSEESRIQEILHHSDNNCKECLQCEIRSRSEGVIMYDRSIFDTVQFRQALVRFTLHVQGHGGNCVETLEIELDRVSSTQVADCLKMRMEFRMRRRPIPSRFPLEILSGWLAASTRWVSLHGKGLPFSSLDSLMRTGRFRLIDITSGEIIAFRDLVSYVTLSYVWGVQIMQSSIRTPVSIVLGRSATTCRKRYLDLKTAPRTIRDAATLMRSIGERYLWVDSICIDQSDPEDQQEVIPQMFAIYQNAYLTIIAASGEGPDAGLAGLRQGQRILEQPTVIWSGGQARSLLPARPPMKDIVNGTKWHSRAWTFQEWLLSSRCLFFTPDEVLFSSREFEAREAYELKHDDEVFLSSRFEAWEAYGLLGDGEIDEIEVEEPR